jgi:hypothetical protein
MAGKNDVIEYYLGDWFRYMMFEKKLSPMLFVVAILWALIYFRVLRPHGKNNKFSLKEYVYIGGAVLLTITAIISQVLLSIGYFS